MNNKEYNEALESMLRAEGNASKINKVPTRDNYMLWRAVNHTEVRTSEAIKSYMIYSDKHDTGRQPYGLDIERHIEGLYKTSLNYVMNADNVMDVRMAIKDFVKHSYVDVDNEVDADYIHMVTRLGGYLYFDIRKEMSLEKLQDIWSRLKLTR